MPASGKLCEWCKKPVLYGNPEPIGGCCLFKFRAVINAWKKSHPQGGKNDGK